MDDFLLLLLYIMYINFDGVMEFLAGPISIRMGWVGEGKPKKFGIRVATVRE